MRKFGRCFLLPFAIGALLALTGTSSAHSPYFTRSADIPLPDGRVGKLRLLHGDGILASDPVRLVLLDAEGRLLARSEKARSLDIVCRPQRASCWGYDRDTLELIKPIPSDFRFGGPSYGSAGSRADNDPIWALEDGPESWGFIRRPAPVREVLSALAQELARPGILVGTAVFAALCFFAFLPRLPKRLDRSSTRFKVIAIGVIVLQIGAGLLALGVALLSAMLLETSLLALCLAGLMGAALAHCLRKRAARIWA